MKEVLGLTARDWRGVAGACGALTVFAALVLCVALGLLASCGAAPSAPTNSRADAVDAIAPSYEDIQRGVACYRLPGTVSTLSCVKVR